MLDYPSHHPQKLAAVVYGGYIYTSTNSGVNWTAQTDAGSRNWISIASSADGSVRVRIQTITPRAPCHCPGSWLHRVCMCCQGSPCNARSDASCSTTNPIMPRNLQPWFQMTLSIRRRTRVSPGRRKPLLVHVTGIRSRPRRMARYVFECRPLRNVHHATVLDRGYIVCACLIKGRHMMLDLTHHGRLLIPSCTETCRCG